MTDFRAFAVPETALDALQAQGITTPTAIQAAAIPAALEGRSVLIQSQTGTGKTIAYLLPLLAKLNPASQDVQAMIIAPTHELCMQIVEQIRKLIAGTTVKVLPLIGGAALSRQVDKLKDRPQIVVGSTGRLLELATMRRLKLHNVSMVVLDEVDRLLEPKTQAELTALLKQTAKDRQLFAVSATLGQAVEAFAAEWSKEPLTVRVDAEDRPAATLTHYAFPGDPRDRVDMVRRLVRTLEAKAAIVFVKDPKRMLELLDKLNFKGLTIASLHSGERKQERVDVLRAFRTGKVQILIATDIAARGLDLPNVELVINFDLPVDAKAYLHRAGRTGRAGQPGTVASLVSNQDLFVVERFAKALQFELLPVQLSHGAVVPLTVKTGPHAPQPAKPPVATGTKPAPPKSPDRKPDTAHPPKGKPGPARPTAGTPDASRSASGGKAVGPKPFAGKPAKGKPPAGRQADHKGRGKPKP